MSKKAFTTAIISILLVSNIILIAFVFLDGNGPGGRDHDRPRNIIIEKLDLDEDQIKKYDELIHWHREQISMRDQRIFELKNKLYKQLALKDNHTDVNVLIDSIAQLQKEAEQIHYRHFNDIKLLCREEQLPAYNKLLKEIAGIFSHRQGPPPPPKK